MVGPAVRGADAPAAAEASSAIRRRRRLSVTAGPRELPGAAVPPDDAGQHGAQTALRGRRRQYATRAHLDELVQAQARLQQALDSLGQLNDSLEQRVAAQIAQRERAEEQLRQAQKMEMLGQLTGGVAHDFNNLLMVVMVNLELIGRLTPDNPMARQLIDAAQQSARRGAALTQRLLAFSRRQELNLESHDLARLLQGMRDLLQRSLGTTYTLRLTLPEDLPPALVDANQLELAVLNLAINGRDAMPDGGELHLEVSQRAAPGELAGCGPADYLCISVIDHGQGMDEETLRRAREPFFSTKPPGKGTGLGLSMIDGLARQLRGALRLESAVGRGTRAELWLPAAPATIPTVPSTGQSPAAEPAGMTTLRVLLVDDDVQVARGTQGLLESLGHEVMLADSGAAALALLAEGPPPDVVITDYSMPQMTGAQLARAVRALHPELPIILATGYAEFPPGDALDLPRLNKPYERSALADQLRQVAGARHPYLPQGTQPGTQPGLH
jgi:signal transduction histidine kinase